MKLSFPAWLIRLTGDIYLPKTPLWLLYKPSHHKVTGPQVRNVLRTVLPGDILLRRYDRYLNTLLTPGFWGHAAMYVGNDEVVHAVSKGVIGEDILSFCRTDSICVLRAIDEHAALVPEAVNKAKAIERIHPPYDYDFKNNNGSYYCTEFVDACYRGLLDKDYRLSYGNWVLVPDGVRNSRALRMVRECRDGKECEA